MKLVVSFLVLTLLFSGCSGGSGSDASASPSAKPPPPPIVAFSKEIKACTPSDPDGKLPPTPVTGKFEVKDGYDELIISWHESGTGKANANVLYVEEGQKVWDKPEHNVLPTAAQCGGHSHSGDGETKKVEPGNYTVYIGFTGSVALHLEITARSSRVASNSTMDHAGHTMMRLAP